MIDYAFYVNEYRGFGITEEEWPALAARAQAMMSKWQRSFQVEGDDRDMAMAICCLAEGLRDADAGDMLCSASIGSVSVEYRTSGKEKKLLDRVGSFVSVCRGVG